MKINNSDVTLGALDQMRRNGRDMGDITRRLASGLRINFAADDPAGMFIATGMRGGVMGLKTAVQNMQDGINMLRTSEGGLAEASDIVNRIRDLCVKGANEAVISDDDRLRMQAEIDSLIDEVNRISESTTYNTKKVNCENDNYSPLVTTLSATTVNHSGGSTPGPGDAAYDEMVTAVTGMVQQSLEKVFGALGISTDSAYTLDINFTDIDGNGNILATGGGAPGAMQINIDIEDFLESYDQDPAGANLGYGPSYGFTYEQVVAHEMTHAAFIGIGGGGGSAWGQEMLASVVSGETDVRLKGNEAAVKALVSGAGNLMAAPAGSDDYAVKGLAGKFIAEKFGASALRDVCREVIGGADFDAAIETVLGNEYADFAEFETECDTWSEEYIDSGQHLSAQRGGLGNTLDTVNEVASNGWELQMDADNSGSGKSMLFTPWTAAGSLDYLPFVNVSSQQQARESLTTMDRVVHSLAQAQNLVGVQERTIQHAIDEVMNRITNLEASRSSIEDADFAQELAGMTRVEILSQGAASALQATNNLAQRVLDLMGYTFAQK